MPYDLRDDLIDVIHGGDAVAELKRIAERKPLARCSVIHGGDVVAELKLHAANGRP